MGVVVPPPTEGVLKEVEVLPNVKEGVQAARFGCGAEDPSYDSMVLLLTWFLNKVTIYFPL
jgi:hypothetical protein